MERGQMISKLVSQSQSQKSLTSSFRLVPNTYNSITCAAPTITGGVDYSIPISKTWANEIMVEEWGSVFVDSPEKRLEDMDNTLIVNVELKEYDPTSGDYVELLTDFWDSTYVLFLHRKTPSGDEQIHGLVLMHTIPPLTLDNIDFEQALDALQFEMPIQNDPTTISKLELELLPIFERRIRSPNTDIKGEPRIYKDESTGTVIQTRLGAYAMMNVEQVQKDSRSDRSVYSFGITGYMRRLDKVEIVQFGTTCTIILVKREAQVRGIVLINTLIAKQSLIPLSSGHMGDLMEMEDLFLKIYIEKGNSGQTNSSTDLPQGSATTPPVKAVKTTKVPKIRSITLGRPIQQNEDQTLTWSPKQAWANQILTEQMGAVYLKFLESDEPEPENNFLNIKVFLNGYSPDIGDCVNTSMDADSGSYVLILRRKKSFPFRGDKIRGLAILHAVSHTSWENCNVETLKLNQLLFKTPWNKVLPYSLIEDPNCLIPDWYIKYRLGQNIRLDCKGHKRRYELDDTSIETRLGVYLHEIDFIREYKTNFTVVCLGISQYSKYLDVIEVLKFGVNQWKHEGSVVLVKRDNIVRGLVFINALVLSQSNQRGKWKIQRLLCGDNDKEESEEMSEIFLKIYIYDGCCRPWLLGYIHWIVLGSLLVILIILCIIVIALR